MLKVKYVGFGGCMERPYYEDENGRLYFDENDGRNGLRLCTGAYRHEDGDIWGEPETSVTEEVVCDKPFVRHPREFDYMMLCRLKMDCDYFLGNGNGYEGHLYYKSVEEHCDGMEKIWNSFADDEKPEWLTMEQIKEYREQMLKARRI
nr:LPD11 domain-containing protein [Clostridium sp. Marseille-P7770]